MSATTDPTPDQLRLSLLKTEARLEGARQRLTTEEAHLATMSRVTRRTRDGARQAQYVERLRATVEAITAVLMGIRFELGEGPEPTACPHTTPGPHGERLPCQAGWGHAGYHVHVGQVRRRWE